MKLDVTTVGGNHPIQFVIEDASAEQAAALQILAQRHGHLVTVVDVVEVLVEVDVATARPPRVHARTWTWIAVERRNRTDVQYQAEHAAMDMAMCHPHVVMVLGARIIDWKDPAHAHT